MITVEETIPKKVPGYTSLTVAFPYREEYIDIIKSLEGSIYDKSSKTWETPVINLAELIDRFSMFDSIELRLYNEPNTHVEHVIDKYNSTPFKHQVEGIQFGLNHNKWLLLDEAGLGKTLQIIYIALELKKRHNLRHCLIICGVNSLKYNWKREIKIHSGYDAVILGEKTRKKGTTYIGSVKDRLEQLINPIDEFFIITNIETIRDRDIVEAINNDVNGIDMVVVDEIHTCVSSQSTQGSHLLSITYPKYKIGATGTLLLNNPIDAYVPLKWIGVEHASLTNVKKFYCNFGGPFKNIPIGFKHLDVLKDQIERCSLRRKKDLLNLPPKIIIPEYVEMSVAQDTFYNNIKAGIIDEVDKVRMSTTSLLAMVTRLRQATDLPNILTTENIGSAKIDRACDLAQQIISGGSKVLIYSTYKETVYELAKRLQEYNPLVCTGDVKDEVVDNNKTLFQTDPKYKVIVATWAKLGVGHTLTAADHAIFISTPWTDAVFSQACDRIHRIGTKDTVFIHNLITKDTIDERVFEILNDKRAISQYVVDDELSGDAIMSLRKYIEELK